MRISGINYTGINRANVQSVNNNDKVSFQALNVLYKGEIYNFIEFSKFVMSKIEAQSGHTDSILGEFERKNTNLFYESLHSEKLQNIFKEARLKLDKEKASIQYVLGEITQGRRNKENFSYARVIAAKFLLDRFNNTNFTYRIVENAISKPDVGTTIARANILGLYSKHAVPEKLLEIYENLERTEAGNLSSVSILPYAVNILANSLPEKEASKFLRSFAYNTRPVNEGKIAAIIEISKRDEFKDELKDILVHNFRIAEEEGFNKLGKACYELLTEHFGLDGLADMVISHIKTKKAMNH